MKRTSTWASYLILTLLCLGTVANGDDKQSVDVKPYGYVKLDGSYDQNLTSHGNYVMWVNPQSYEDDDAQFNMTANQTRLGLKMTSEGTGSVEVRGAIEFDLYAAGAAENKAELQLRHAYFTVTSGQFELTAGQTWDLVSPLNPATLNYSVLWGCGNTGYRRPQVRLTYTVPAGSSTDVSLAGGFFRTIGSDLTPTFSLALDESSDGSDDGTDAAIPSFQGALDLKHRFGDKGLFRLGVSGLYGQLRAETNKGNYETYESQGIWGHLMLQMPSGLGVSGEFYTGTNLGGYLGGILQSSTIAGVESIGCWGSAWVKISPKVKLTGGYGYDDVKDEDIATGRSQNSCVFGNLTYALVSNVTVGVEVSRWETDYRDGESASSMRGQSSFMLNF